MDSEVTLMKMLLALICLFSLSLAQGESFERFDKRFKVIRNSEGKITHIRAKGILTGFHFMPYIKGLKSDLISMKNDLISKSQKVNHLGELESDVYVEDVLNMIQADSYSNVMIKGSSPVSPRKKAKQRRKYLRKAFLNLPTADINGAFGELKTKGFLKKVGDALKKFYLQRDVRIISAPYYKTFFYEQRVTNTVAAELLKFARKRLGSIPVLNIAIFIIDDLMAKIEEQREISQNIFLYYIVNYEDKLKFSKAETNMIVSSVYESRIPVTGYQTSKFAKNNWEDFGWSSYDKAPRIAADRMRLTTNMFESSSKVDFTFYEVMKKGKRVIINASMKNHMFSSSPAESFYYDKPMRIRTLRTLVRIGQMALGFVPKVPSFIKSAVNSFSNSWYKEQAKFEAFLFAHFEAKDDKEMMKLIGNQINNPFYVFL